MQKLTKGLATEKATAEQLQKTTSQRSSQQTAENKKLALEVSKLKVNPLLLWIFPNINCFLFPGSAGIQQWSSVSSQRGGKKTDTTAAVSAAERRRDCGENETTAQADSGEAGEQSEITVCMTVDMQCTCRSAFSLYSYRLQHLKRRLKS